jgi:NAD(P)-dependent dehydrogenase (short-subunit alcohol dehydrogenase family)
LAGGSRLNRFGRLLAAIAAGSKGLSHCLKLPAELVLGKEISMNLGLAGKRAFVSGSTAGIGFAIAARLAAEEAEVVISGRTQQRVDSALQKLAHLADCRISGIAADLSTAEGARTVIGRLPELDILVNNLGAFGARPFPEISDEEWTQILQTNLFSGIRLSRHYLPQMLSRNKGRVIFISSESALNIPVEMIHYGVTKTAQAALARGLAELTVGTNVTVNTILAGPTRSEGVERFIAGLAKQKEVSAQEVERSFFEDARPTSLLQRFIRPEEVADVVAFVASECSSSINGAAVRADGGVVRTVF